MNWLLDGNVLIALIWSGHPFHDRVRRWRLRTREDGFATCPVTEGTLLRLHMQFARDRSAGAAWAALASLHAHPRHFFWPEGFSYAELQPVRISGHRQVTDSWLVELARRKGARLATLDEALSVLYPEIATLIPV